MTVRSLIFLLLGMGIAVGLSVALAPVIPENLHWVLYPVFLGLGLLAYQAGRD